MPFCLGCVCWNPDLSDLHNVDGVRADRVPALPDLRRSDLGPEEADLHRPLPGVVAELHDPCPGPPLGDLPAPAPVRGVLHVVLRHRLHVGGGGWGAGQPGDRPAGPAGPGPPAHQPRTARPVLLLARQSTAGGQGLLHEDRQKFCE